MTIDPSVEVVRLRATLRDLLALSAMPEVWVGREPPALATELADLLIESLRLDFAFVRLCDPGTRQTVEAMRGDAWNTFPEWLQQRLAVSGQISWKEIVNQVSGPEKSFGGIVIPVGVNGERGLVAAACYRSDFPDQIEQQLLSVAANSAATAFRNAYLINELRNAQKVLRDREHELRTARDELEIRVAERTAELRRSERELRGVIDSIPAIVWSALPDGSNSYANSRFVEYCGMPPEQIAGSGWQAATHPDDLERHNAKWLTCVASGEPCEDEVRFRRADGQYRWFLVRAVPVHDESGKISKWYGVLTDIEDRKGAEEERERLRQLQAELAHLDRLTTMGELTASLAHELNQPITAAITSANACLLWLDRDPPDLERARAAIARVDRDSTRAAEVIKRLRAFYRKDVAPLRQSVDVSGVVREMIELLGSEAYRYSVSMRTNLAPDLSHVEVDRVQLQQVFMNLMLNAIEAMKDGGGELTVTSGYGEDGRILISVSDSGPGLPDGNLDQIFNAFFTTKPEGTGMGLAISRSIVESHGGRLWATNNAGRGATFYFTLPSKSAMDT